MLAAVILSTLAVALSVYNLVSLWVVWRISLGISAAVERSVLLRGQVERLRGD